MQLNLCLKDINSKNHKNINTNDKKLTILKYRMKEFLTMDDKFLEGKGAVITGGASGFGRGVARAFAERGAKLALIDVNEDLLEQTSKQIQDRYNAKVIPIVCDVSKSDQVEAMAKQAYNELENVYILFNNAGIALSYGINICRFKEENWDKVMNTNLKGQWLVAKAFCRKMKTQKFEPIAGKMVNTASIAGMVVDGGSPVYSISKTGIIALTKLLSQTLAPKITVNSISPGLHVTGIFRNSEEEVRLKAESGHIKTPLNRVGTVEDVVNLLIFLASPKSNFITGHNFPIDGGIAEVGVPPNYIKSNI